MISKIGLNSLDVLYLMADTFLPVYVQVCGQGNGFKMQCLKNMNKDRINGLNFRLEHP